MLTTPHNFARPPPRYSSGMVLVKTLTHFRTKICLILSYPTLRGKTKTAFACSTNQTSSYTGYYRYYPKLLFSKTIETNNEGQQKEWERTQQLC